MALSFLSVHNNIFCPYCEGWSSTFALESGKFSLEAYRVLLPFPVLTAEMPVTLVICCLSCKRGDTCFCLLSSATLKLVECFRSKRRGSPLNTVQCRLRSCASPSASLFLASPGELLCHRSAVRPVTLPRSCPCQCFQAYSACLCFQLSCAQRGGRGWT